MILGEGTFDARAAFTGCPMPRRNAGFRDTVFPALPRLCHDHDAAGADAPGQFERWPLRAAGGSAGAVGAGRRIDPASGSRTTSTPRSGSF